MPNHCWNSLDCSIPEGSKVKLEDIKKKIFRVNEDGKTIVDFGIVVPEPVYEDDQAWYPWRIENWGTKWNAYDTRDGDSNACVLDDRSGTFEGVGDLAEFTTAWGPPEAWLKALSNEFPDVTFTLRYDIEMGNGRGLLTALDADVSDVGLDDD